MDFFIIQSLDYKLNALTVEVQKHSKMIVETNSIIQKEMQDRREEADRINENVLNIQNDIRALKTVAEQMRILQQDVDSLKHTVAPIATIQNNIATLSQAVQPLGAIQNNIATLSQAVQPLGAIQTDVTSLKNSLWSLRNADEEFRIALHTLSERLAYVEEDLSEHS